MAWIFSRALEGLPSRCKTGLAPPLIAKSTPIVKVSSCKECKKGICPVHQFGTTFEHYQQTNYQQLTSSMVGFPVKISRLQELKRAWNESEAVFFSKFYESSMKRKLPSYSLKTSQTLGQKEQSEFVKNWPKEGMIVGGVIYPLQMWERGIKEKDGSYWATPSAQEAGEMDWMKGCKPNQRAYNPKTGKHTQMTLNRAVKYWPTPQAWDSARGPAKQYDPKSKKQVERTLVTFAKHFPTPAARDWKDNASPSEYNRNTPTLATHAGGQLNPMWVEWLQGYRIGHTELKPLETP